MSASYDLEAQMPAAPASAVSYTTTRASISSSASSDITVFGTHDSRHSTSRPVSEVLPPYFEAPPAYTARGSSEPATLAMYLFKLGFCEYFLHSTLVECYTDILSSVPTILDPRSSHCPISSQSSHFITTIPFV